MPYYIINGMELIGFFASLAKPPTFFWKKESRTKKTNMEQGLITIK